MNRWRSSIRVVLKVLLVILIVCFLLGFALCIHAENHYDKEISSEVVYATLTHAEIYNTAGVIHRQFSFVDTKDTTYVVDVSSAVYAKYVEGSNVTFVLKEMQNILGDTKWVIVLDGGNWSASITHLR